MDVSFINHFVASATKVFDTMLNCPIQRTSVQLKSHDNTTHEVSAVIGLSGKVSASVVLSMSESLALRAAGEMMLTEYTEVDAEVSDAIGELSNMVAGGAKMRMPEMELALGMPNVFIGVETIYFPAGVKPLSIGFSTPWGDMALDVGFDTEISGDVEAINQTEQAVS